MFKKTVLPNNLRIITAPMAGTNTVSVLVMCGTGSDYETKEINGISHFLEHMFFKGTANRPNPKLIREELDGMGSESNAFTSHETTGYYIKAGRIHLDRALDILVDIYRNSLLAEDEIEREKQVVVEEMHLDKDTPTIHIWRLWERLLYGDQPAGWDIAGDEATVRGFRREALVQYFTHQYVAGFVAGEEMLTGSPLTVDEVFAKLDAVTTKDISRVVGELLRPSRLNVTLLGPLADSDTFKTIINSFS